MEVGALLARPCAVVRFEPATEGVRVRANRVERRAAGSRDLERAQDRGRLDLGRDVEVGLGELCDDVSVPSAPGSPGLVDDEPDARDAGREVERGVDPDGDLQRPRPRRRTR